MSIWVLGSLLSGRGECSKYKLTSIIDGEEKINVCQKDILGTVIPDYQPTEEIPTAWKSSFAVQNMCPSLVYTCCSAEALEEMFAFFRETVKFFEYREKATTKLFETLHQIKDSQFLEFLNQLTEQDMRCYTNRYIFGDKPREVKKLMNYFVYVKASAKEFIKLTRLNNQRAVENYYSYICATCSPYMFKVFRENPMGQQEISLNQNNCPKILMDKIRTVDMMMINNNLQHIVDIVLCAKHNSMRDFTGLTGPIDFADYSFNAVGSIVLSSLRGKLEDCLNYKNAFLDSEFQNNLCTSTCTKGISYFSSSFDNFAVAMNVENELYNTFFDNSDQEKSRDRMNQITKEYTNIRDTMNFAGNIGNVTSSGKFVIYNFKQRAKTKFNPDNIVYAIQNQDGLDLSEFAANSAYYASAFRAGLQIFFFVVVLFGTLD